MRDHKDMFEYVKLRLDKQNASSGVNKTKITYDRYDHVVRVYKWMLRIVMELKDDSLDTESLKIATIFHDIGYGLETESKPHSVAGAELCRDYLERRNYPPEKIEFICDMICKHSEKKLMWQKNTPLELIVLMEADMLDDTGAMGIILDAWIESKEDNPNFNSFLKHIQKYTYSQMKNVEMVTAPAKKFWHQKRKLVYDFVREYQRDLGDMRG